MRSSRHLLALSIVGSGLLGIGAGAAARDDLEARLRPFNEVPSVSSAASGRFKARIDERANTLSYTLSYSGLEGDVRQAHIHLGQKDVNGGVMVFLCQTTANPDPVNLAPVCPQSGSVQGMIQAANIIGPAGQGVDPMEFAAFLAAVRGGVAYVNVHSVKFPGGEIRGQLRDDD